MNSKESLNNIKNLFIGSPINLTQQFEIIEKDLEILEILKRNIYVADNTIYATPNELEKDDYKKLKEWYENEQKRKI